MVKFHKNYLLKRRRDSVRHVQPDHSEHRSAPPGEASRRQPAVLAGLSGRVLDHTVRHAVDEAPARHEGARQHGQGAAQAQAVATPLGAQVAQGRHLPGRDEAVRVSAVQGLVQRAQAPWALGPDEALSRECARSRSQGDCRRAQEVRERRERSARGGHLVQEADQDQAHTGRDQESEMSQETSSWNKNLLFSISCFELSKPGCKYVIFFSSRDTVTSQRYLTVAYQINYRKWAVHSSFFTCNSSHRKSPGLKAWSISLIEMISS